MAKLINKTMESYNYVFYELADPRTSDFFLMSSPVPVTAIAGFYLYFCTSFGPHFMRDRKPYDLKQIVMLYNVFQIFLSAYLFSLGVRYMLAGEFKFNCTPIDYSSSPWGLFAARATWWYFIAKVTELMDTVFFVLRKKNNQVSFLHVYHHTIMCLATWQAVKFIPGGNPALMATLNSFVHIVMYTYYFISGLGPKYQKYIWWKKHVTILQLVQFTIILYHSVNAIFQECSYPLYGNLILATNASLFLYLFGKFYIDSYKKSSKPQKNEASNGKTHVKGE